MDIFTEQGQKTLADEENAVAIYHLNSPGYQYIHTPKDMPAIVDGLIISNKIHAVVETKCRYNLTLDQFENNYKNQWLVTHEKIVKAAKVGESLGVPLVGFLYLVEDQCLLIKQISDSLGFFVADMEVRDTETQKTVNGGKVIRTNCFIDMNGAKTLFG